MFNLISGDDILNVDKTRLLKEADIGKLNGRVYFKSYLRQCFADSPKLYLHKPTAEELAEFRGAQNLNEPSKLPALRRIPSDEILSYDDDDLTREHQSQPEDSREARKRTDPTYETLMKKIKAFRTASLVLTLPRPRKSSSDKYFTKKSESVHSYRKADSYLVNSAICTTKGIVDVYKPCAIDIKKSALKVNNVEISTIRKYQNKAETFRNSMSIDINKSSCKINDFNATHNNNDSCLPCKKTGTNLSVDQAVVAYLGKIKNEHSLFSKTYPKSLPTIYETSTSSINEILASNRKTRFQKSELEDLYKPKEKNEWKSSTASSKSVENVGDGLNEKLAPKRVSITNRKTRSNYSILKKVTIDLAKNRRKSIELLFCKGCDKRDQNIELSNRKSLGATTNRGKSTVNFYEQEKSSALSPTRSLEDFYSSIVRSINRMSSRYST